MSNPHLSLRKMSPITWILIIRTFWHLDNLNKHILANIWLFQKTRNPSFSLFMTISCLYARNLEIEGTTLSPCCFVPLLQFIFMIIKWVSLSIFMWTQSNLILQKFRNSFPEENLAKAASAALMRSLFKITIFIIWEQSTH